MFYKEKQIGSERVIPLNGRLDAQNAPLLEKHLLTSIKGERIRIVLDLGKLEYLSSSGIRTFVTVLKACCDKKGDCRLAQVQPSVYNILALGGFDAIFKIFETAQEAVESFGE